MSLERTHYDAVILGTGLTESILAAALARAGKHVLHVDPRPFYGGAWASLSLSELHDWAKSAGDEVELAFPIAANSAEANKVPAALASKDRHYSLSLLPTLLPASGRALDTLVRSKVAAYATFRLLERTVLYSKAQDGSVASLKGVPCSKEDVFRDRSLALADKRRIMKLLMAIGSGEASPSDPNAPFLSYLRDTHSLSASVAEAIAYGVSLCSAPSDPTGAAMERAKSHLKATGRYGNSSYLVGQYGGAGELAQSYCRAAAVHGATYILAHDVTKLERIEASKSAAISGSEGEAAESSASARWKVNIAEIGEDITADWVVGSSELLKTRQATALQEISDTPASGSLDTMHALLVLDRPLPLAPVSSGDDADASSSTLPPETALVVFPPGTFGNLDRSITVLTMGEGTFSCPKGQYVYYLVTSVPAGTSASPKQVLSQAIDELLRLASGSTSEWQLDGTVRRPTAATESSESTEVTLLLTLYYRQRASTALASSAQPNLLTVAFPPPPQATSGTGGALVSALDDAAAQAEALFWSIEGDEAKLASDARAEARRKRRDPAEYVGRVGAVEADDDDDLGESVEFFAQEEEQTGADDE